MRRRRGFLVTVVLCGALVAGTVLTSTQRGVVQNARWVRERMDRQRAQVLLESVAAAWRSGGPAIGAGSWSGESWTVRATPGSAGSLEVTVRCGDSEAAARLPAR